ncbi:MAG: hypothetical protein HQL46_04225, partial [Gammaproteobacteria bacterium]|nr:hypothetical protein [Gammaproteobacteria bacterium]
MSDELNNKENENTPVDENQGQQGSDFEKRRKLLKGALGATPVIMTVAARPVHAMQGLSHMLSLEVSGCKGDDFVGGQSPGWWMTVS